VISSRDEDDYDDADGEMDLNKVIEYQHKILRKYTMTGMISYSDAPQLHDMVDNRNYRMICIFEVLTQNRIESDFLENLGLLSQVAREQE
jgi:hypothetical protein